MARTTRGQLTVQQLEDRTTPATVSIAESVFDLDQFEANLRERLENNVVGFAYAIREHDGNQPLNNFTEVAGGWGYAQTPNDTAGGLAMTEYMSMEIASVSKPVTAVAIMRLLQDQIGATDDFTAELNAKLDQSVVDFLPADWDYATPDDGKLPIDGITIRDLLTHESGFQDYALTYEFVRDVVESGTTNDPDYSTTNFSLLRILLPYMWESVVDRDILDGNRPASELPEDLKTALESLFGKDVDDLTKGELTAGIYNYYVRTHVLEPAGITGGDTKHPPGDSTVLVYDFPANGPGEDTGDQTLNAGGRGWNLSAYELQQFLTAARYDDNLLSPETRAVMFGSELGWFAPTNLFGQRYIHNGGNFGGTNTDDDGSSTNRVNTYVTNLPNGVNASLVINSQLGNNLPKQGTIVNQAYESAWPVLVIEGDSGDDTFILRSSATDPDFLELVVNGEVVMLHKDVIQSLTLRGQGGNDTFQIETLPASAELVLEGGAGDDDFVIDANGIGGVYGSITIGGGDGDKDALAVHGINDGFGTPDTYELAGDTIDWADYGATFAYSRVETVELTAGTDASNSFVITGPLSASTVTVNGSSGDETFAVSGVGAGTELNLYGRAGSDTFNVLSATGAVNVIGDNPGLFGGADTLNLGAGDLNAVSGTVAFNGGGGPDGIVLNDTSATAGREITFTASSIDPNGAAGYYSHSGVESITYQGTARDDRLAVRSLGRETTLELFGRGGGDTFLVSDVAHNVDSVLGTVIVHGDAGPTTEPAPGKPDTLAVYDDQNPTAGAYTVEAATALTGTIEKPVGQTHDRVRVRYDGIENAALFAGLGDDTIKVESTPVLSSLAVHTGSGFNTVSVSPTARTLDTLLGALSVNGGGTDSLAVDDRNSAAVVPYVLSAGNVARGPRAVAHTGVDKVTLWVNANGNPIAVNSTAPGSTTAVIGNAGNDVLTATAPAGAVYFEAGAGTDTARLIGTGAADVFEVRGETVSLGSGLLVTDGVERREIDGGGATDSLNVRGVEGVNEQFRIRPSHIAYQGTIEPTPHSPVRYLSVENFRVDADPTDADTLRVDGRRHGVSGLSSYDDVFAIDLAAAATSKDPVLTLSDAADTKYFRLIDFTGLSGVDIDGLGGNDTFDVTLDPQPRSVSRAVRIHGSGNSLAGDKVNVRYAPPEYILSFDEGLGAGGVFVGYSGLNYGIEFDGIEDWNLLPFAVFQP